MTEEQIRDFGRRMTLPLCDDECDALAREIVQAAQPNPAPDLAPIKAELRWCIENAQGPRTESALRWALEVLEDIEAEVGT